MNLYDITREFDENGSLSNDSLGKLKEALQGVDPYQAITVVTDCGLKQFAPCIAKLLRSKNSMVRWNALGSLFTRFKWTENVDMAIDMASSDPDSMVRSMALCSLGEILPLLVDPHIREDASRILIDTLENEREFPELRASAYEAILAANGVPPQKRPPATRIIDLSQEVDQAELSKYRNRYLT
jgi:hypothetical protein